MIDTRPLRHSRQFRLLSIGFAISTIGSQFTVVAIPIQVYATTHSSLQVGLISFAQLIPLICGSLIGGAIGDHRDRRQIMLEAASAATVFSGLLALNAWAWSSNLFVLYIIAALAAFVAGLSGPSRTASVPKIVDAEHLTGALAFNQVILQFGGIVGPALAGVLIATAGIPLAYVIDAVSFVAVVVASLLMEPVPPSPGAMKPGLKSIAEGFSFLRGKPILQSVYLVDLSAMVFGLPRALFPAMAATVYGVGPSLLGLLYAAPGIGAFLGAITTGWLHRVTRRGRAISLAVALWGGAIVVFGLSGSYVVGICCLALAGWADVLSAVLRNTVLQTSIPDHFRSRLSAIQIAVVQGGPKLGDLESGAVAAATSTLTSVVSGGLLCIAGVAALALWRPAFWAERAPTAPSTEATN